MNTPCLFCDNYTLFENKMNWSREKRSKLSHQEVAEQILQIYTKALQDLSTLRGILSEFSVLDYFGKIYYGEEAVSSHLISNLHGCNYELSSLSINDHPPVIQWDSVGKAEEKPEEDFGVTLISPPKAAFPSLTFSTPVRSFSQPRKRIASEVLVENYNRNFKVHKSESNGDQSSSSKKTDNEHPILHLSPQTIQAMFPNEIRYLTAYGTIQYPKRVVPMMEPKRIKHHSLITLRDRFCQLYIGFECDEHVISVTNCKIWTIKYSFSSRVTPRNLLKAFNEVEKN